ncbi:MAG: hypothetical protein Q9184_006562 [Pyrenodesmia sp. 2 TL-2023]
MAYETFCLHNISSLPPLSLSPPPPFPFRPCLWEPSSPNSICAFLNYTRNLKAVLVCNPDYFHTHRFELEAYILLLHTCYPEEGGRYVWFAMARQLLGRLLACYEPEQLRTDERTWAAVRVQSACRDLIWPKRWKKEDARVRGASVSMETVVRRAMLAVSWSEQDGVKDLITSRDLRRCEAWLHKVVLPSVQHVLESECNVSGKCEAWLHKVVLPSVQRVLEGECKVSGKCEE